MSADAFERVADEEQTKSSRLSGWLSLALARQQGRAFLWWPIALTLGIWTYFALWIGCPGPVRGRPQPAAGHAGGTRCRRLRPRQIPQRDGRHATVAVYHV